MAVTTRSPRHVSRPQLAPCILRPRGRTATYGPQCLQRRHQHRGRHGPARPVLHWATMSYHLVAYAPWRATGHGQRTEGRLELDVEERSYVSGAGRGRSWSGKGRPDAVPPMEKPRAIGSRVQTSLVTAAGQGCSPTSSASQRRTLRPAAGAPRRGLGAVDRRSGHRSFATGLRWCRRLGTGGDCSHTLVLNGKGRKRDACSLFKRKGDFQVTNGEPKYRSQS